MARSVLKFPLEISNEGKTVITADPANELQQLFLFSPNSRVDIPDYGVAGELMLQIPNNNEFLTTALLSMREAVVQYAAQVGVTSMSVSKNERERSVTVNLKFVASPQFGDTFSSKAFLDREKL